MSSGQPPCLWLIPCEVVGIRSVLTYERVREIRILKLKAKKAVTYGMSRKLWNVAENDSIWVLLDVVVGLVRIRGDHTKDLSLSVLKLGMSSEVFPLLGVGELVSHGWRIIFEFKL